LVGAVRLRTSKHELSTGGKEVLRLECGERKRTIPKTYFREWIVQNRQVSIWSQWVNRGEVPRRLSLTIRQGKEKGDDQGKPVATVREREKRKRDSKRIRGGGEKSVDFPPPP